MASNRSRREQLYNEYAANLALVKKTRSITPDIPDSIICPLCFQMFERTSLDIPQKLTLEHVPSKRLGGRDSQTLLVCGDCNHHSGTKLDAQAKVHLDISDFVAGLPGASAEGLFTFGSTPEFVAKIRYDETGKLHIKRDAKRVNPAIGRQEADYLQSIVGKTDLNVTAKMSFTGPNPLLASIAWLRYAYLLFFKWFGYAGVLHPHLDQVRKQIQNPEETLFPSTWEALTSALSSFQPGMHAIQKPVELQGFICIFDMSTPLRTIRRAIILPNLSQPGLAIYDRLLSLREARGGGMIEGVQLPQLPELWTDRRAWLFGLYQVFSV